MKEKFSIITVLIFLLITGCNSKVCPKIDSRLQSVRSDIIELVSSGEVPSISIAVAKDGEIIWEESFGYSDLENQIKATPHTKYRSASIAKTITATGLMTLVEQGLVDLDKPILEYIPDISMKSFVGNEEEITVRQILNHRSGLAPYCAQYFEDDNEEPLDFHEIANRYGIFAFPPDWTYIYSNLGYELAGYLITQVSGINYSEYIQENVFLPLGMNNSVVYEKGLVVKDRALCYRKDLQPLPDYYAAYPGAEDIFFSAHDLILFAMFHLKNHLPEQNAIISDESIDKMQEYNPPDNKRYGIGWSFDVDYTSYRAVYHGGSGPGSGNIMRLFPSENLAFVILCNTGGLSEYIIDLHDDICNAMVPGFVNAEDIQEEPQQEQSIIEEKKLPDQYFGYWNGKIATYEGDIPVTLKVDQDNGFIIKINDDEEAQIETAVLSENFLLGYFTGTIPTSDGINHSDKIRLAIVRDGDVLYGQATIDHSVEELDVKYELSSWIKLEKITCDESR